MNAFSLPTLEGVGVAPLSSRASKKIIQRISLPCLSYGLNDLTHEIANLGILTNRAFVCHRDHSDFGGSLFWRNRQGLPARQEGAW
jgi:hypothetical protein